MAEQRNIARYVFLQPAARDLFHDWGTQVRGWWTGCARSPENSC